MRNETKGPTSQITGEVFWRPLGEKHLARHQGNCITKTTKDQDYLGSGIRIGKFGMDVAKLGAVEKKVIRWVLWRRQEQRKWVVKRQEMKKGY